MSVRGRISLAILAATMMIGCGGGTASTPAARATVAPGSVLQATGPKGVSLALTVSPDVPSDETLTLSPYMGTLPAAALDAFSLRIGGLTIPVDAFVAMTLRGQPAEPYGYALDFEQTAASGVYATLVGSQGDGGTLTPPCPESNSPAPPAPMEANVTYLVVLEAASPVYCPDN